MGSWRPYNISHLRTVRHKDVLTIGEQTVLCSTISFKLFISLLVFICFSIAIILISIIGAIRSGSWGFAILEISTVGKANPEGTLFSS